MLLGRLSRSGTERTLTKHGTLDPSTSHVVAQLVHFVVLFAGLAVALETLGVSLSAVFAAGAFLAFAAGFAMQSIAQNFVSGVILLIERRIKPGDVLEMGGQVVRVTQMGLRRDLRGVGLGQRSDVRATEPVSPERSHLTQPSEGRRHQGVGSTGDTLRLSSLRQPSCHKSESASRARSATTVRSNTSRFTSAFNANERISMFVVPTTATASSMLRCFACGKRARYKWICTPAVSKSS